VAHRSAEAFYPGPTSANHSDSLGDPGLPNRARFCHGITLESPPPAGRTYRRQVGALLPRSLMVAGQPRHMSILKSSWSAISRDIAKVYLDGFGHPSPNSKTLVASLLRDIFGDKRFRIADFGCGNGHMYAFFKERGLTCEYFGYDFSTSLLEAGRERFPGDANAHFVEADIGNPDLAAEPCDIVLFSHVLEMVASPERSLIAARRTAPIAMIRFFEPPVSEYDVAEVLQLSVGGPATVPYLRRTMSKDYYNLMLNKAGCRSVEVHQVDGDKDQVHLLRFQ
jgi:SAM-dependent methyltransferase